MRGKRDLAPVDRFFVRNHTRTPVLDADTWRLRLFGTGLRGSPTADDTAPYNTQGYLFGAVVRHPVIVN